VPSDEVAGTYGATTTAFDSASDGSIIIAKDECVQQGDGAWKS
jgi:hypothetical protein